MLAYDGEKTAYFFQTSVIDAYVKRCWGRVSKQHAVNKGSYTEYPINLPDVFWHIGVKPIQFNFSIEGIQNAIEQIKQVEIPLSPPAHGIPIQINKTRKKDTPLKSHRLTQTINSSRNGTRINRRGTRGK